MKFILLSFWLLLLPLFQTTLAQDFQSSDAKRAWSKSLLVYEKPDITSNVIGRLIFDEIIREVDNSKTQTEEGTWVKLKSPYEGYYLKQQEADPFSVSGSDKEKRKSHFRSTRQGSIQETPKNEEDEENVENAEKKEETSGFFSHLFGSFFKDDEEQTEIKSEQKKRNVSRFFNQKKGSVWIGLGMGVWSLPEERGYNTSSMSL
ncbi:hypothetical protein KKA14_17950, partial [bacterium]|nr:hypothetical protein [bacterium]